MNSLGDSRLYFIANECMQTFLLDNSALNEILKDEAKTTLLIQSLNGSTNRVVVSIDTITENFAGASEHVVKRIPNLRKTIDSLPVEQFVVANTIWSWLNSERKNNGRFKNIPALINSQRWPGFLEFLKDIDGFVEFHKKLEPDRLEQFKRQAALKESDKTFREKAKQLPDPNEVLSKLLNFKLDPSNSHLRLFAAPLGVSGRLAKKAIVASADYYKIHRSYLAALYLRSLGNAIASFDKYPNFKFLQKIKGGNWFDLAIVVQASQFDFLVSNDNDQRDICSFLNSKSIIKAKAIKLDEFFELISANKHSRRENEFLQKI